MVFEKFTSFLSKTSVAEALAKRACSNKMRLTAGFDIAANFLPLIVGGACAIGGAYGLEAYLLIKLAQGVRDNLSKNKFISDPQKDWYEFIGAKLVKEEDYNKNKDKLKEKISDGNSILASWKNLYDK